MDPTMSIHFNIPSSEKQENSLECLTKRTSSLSYEWRRIVLLCQTASRALAEPAVLEIISHLEVVFLLVVFLSHYAQHLIVAVSIFPIESAELSGNAR